MAEACFFTLFVIIININQKIKKKEKRKKVLEYH